MTGSDQPPGSFSLAEIWQEKIHHMAASHWPVFWRENPGLWVADKIWSADGQEIELCRRF